MQSCTEAMRVSTSLRSGASASQTRTVPNSMETVNEQDALSKNIIRLGAYRVHKQYKAVFEQQNVHLLLNLTMVKDELKALVDGLDSEVKRSNLYVLPSTPQTIQTTAVPS